MSFLPEKQLYRHPVEVPDAPDFVLQESYVVILHILWQVAEENKLRSRALELCYVFDFQVSAS